MGKMMKLENQQNNRLLKKGPNALNLSQQVTIKTIYI